MWRMRLYRWTEFIQVLEQAKRLRLVILDACRDNPFVRSIKRTTIGRSIGRGLAKVDVLTSDTLVAFAAKAGSTAADGQGLTSPYTAALVKHLTTPGLDLRLALGRVRDEVLKSTAKRQEPFVYGSLGGAEIPLVEASKEQSQAEAKVPGPMSEASREWFRVDKGSIAELETFVRRHGSSVEADYARARIEEAKKRLLASTAPPPTPPVTPAVQVTPSPLVAPGTVFRDCPACPEMVVVPAGSFMMGSPAGETGRNSDEGPQHQVMFRTSFAVGRFAVTRNEFAAFVAATGHQAGSCFVVVDALWKQHPDRNWRSPGFAQDGRYPVVCVNWNDAKAYAAWLSSTTNKTYRLLSEAEREYVTRAGTMTPFWWGESISTDRANYNGNVAYGAGPTGEYRAKSVPVNSFIPNPWGLYQVHGNIWEWVEDCWNESYYGAPADGAAWTAGECSLRVVRGGSWFHDPRYLRAAVRGRSTAVHRYYYRGFRVARTLDR